MSAIEKALGKMSADYAQRNFSSQKNSRSRNRLQLDLPLATMEKQGMITPGTRRDALAEEYRAIKRRVLKAADRPAELGHYEDRNKKIIMVTSCISGEGKTYSAINLAISIAMERDRSVLLIDGDVTNPTAGTRLGIEARRHDGLTTLLEQPRINPEEVIWQTSIPNLEFLPAGPVHADVTELLSSRNMEDLIDRLIKRRRDQIVLIDSAPILLTSEASAVADQVGQIAFVVAANSTTRAMVDDALRIINDHSRVGFILNKTGKNQANKGGYGYGYKRAS